MTGFDFDGSKTVLELYCECGAMTRFLGETFSKVVAIEQSMAKARLARMRTRGLDNVSILCVLFQELYFLQKFDIIFYLGGYQLTNPCEDASTYFQRLKPLAAGRKDLY